MGFIWDTPTVCEPQIGTTMVLLVVCWVMPLVSLSGRPVCTHLAAIDSVLGSRARPGGSISAAGIFFFYHPPPVPVFAPPHQTISSTFLQCLRIWPILCTQFMMMARVVVGSGGSDMLCCCILIFRLMQYALHGRFAV